MGLEEELATFRAEFERTAPSGRAALYSAKIEDLRGRFWLEGAPGFASRRATRRSRSGDLLPRWLVSVLQYSASRLPTRAAGDRRVRRADHRDLASASGRVVVCG